MSTALGVCAARTWMSHSRRTAKLPGPLTATATLPKPTSPAFSGQVISSRWLAASRLVSATGRSSATEPVASRVTL